MWASNLKKDATAQGGPVSADLHTVESSWYVMARGDAREDTWKGNWRMEYPVPFTLPRNIVYPALLPLMRTPRLPVVDWTHAPADLKGLVRFAERWNLVSVRVPSHFKCSLQHSCVVATAWRNLWRKWCKQPPDIDDGYEYSVFKDQNQQLIRGSATVRGTDGIITTPHSRQPGEWKIRREGRRAWSV
jgi:hypothetical protein